MRFLRGSYVMLGLVVASLMFVACTSSGENDSGDYVAGPLEFSVSSDIYQHKGTTQPVDITAVLVDTQGVRLRCKLELAVDIE